MATRKKPANNISEERTKAAADAEIFRLLVSSVKDYAIFVLDPEGHIMTWNEGAQRIKQYKESEIVGKHFSIFYTQEARDRKHPDYELEVAKREGKYEEEGWRVRKDGTVFWANVVITTLTKATGEIVGFAKVTRDLTERKIAEAEREAKADELARINEELVRANSAKDVFLANMSHELRTPLNSILGFNDVLLMGLSGPLNDTQMKQAGYIKVAAEHLLSLINDILDLAKVESGNFDLNLKPTNLSSAIESVVSGLQTLAHERNLYLKTQNCQTRTFVRADERSLRQVLTNLISNAIKFTDVGGVTVQCRIEAEKAYIDVVDTGIGISKEDQPKLFKGFVQLVRASRKQEGTGLGLALSKRLMRLMSGDITMHSEIQKGSTFTIEIPLDEEQ